MDNLFDIMGDCVMIKNKIKYTLILLLCLTIAEIINAIIFVYSFSKENYFNGFEVEIMASISLILYFFMGIIIHWTFKDKKSKDWALLTTGKIIMFSSFLSMVISMSTGQYYLIHMMICSPIATLMTKPVDDIPMLYELLLILFSPVSALLIWLFSKIGDKKKTNTADDSWADEN